MNAAKALVALLIAAMLGLIGWWIYGEVTEPKSGTVTGKQWVPPFFTMICTTSNKVTTCNQVYVPECYEVRYADGDRKGDACVAPVEYENYRPGDHFPAVAR